MTQSPQGSAKQVVKYMYYTDWFYSFVCSELYLSPFLFQYVENTVHVYIDDNNLSKTLDRINLI